MPPLPAGFSPGLVLTLARRELRGSLSRFGIFLACLALGVGVIAAVGSLSASVDQGLRLDARALMGGDVELSTSFQPPDAEAAAFLEAAGRVSRVVSIRTMARPAAADAAPLLVEAKAVDSAWPLYGRADLAPALPLAEVLADRDGVHGAAAAPELLERLGVGVGDRLRLGDIEVELRTVLTREPDRRVSAFTLGPRLLVSFAALETAGLLRPGSLARHEWRVRLPEGADAGAFAQTLRERFPDAPWRVHDYHEAAPGLKRLLGQLTLYLTLVGLTALLVGGLGVAGAVDGYLARKRRSIAVLKCVGAPGALAVAVHLSVILLLALGGTLLGVALGAAAPMLAAAPLAGLLPVRLEPGPFPAPLLQAAAFGMLTALAFLLPPLLRAARVRPAALFRAYLHPSADRLSATGLAATAASALALGAFAVGTAPGPRVAAWFLAGVALAFGLLTLLGRACARLARLVPRTGRPRLDLAIGNIRRPGSAAPGAVVSLGLGLSVLVAVGLLDGTLRRQVDRELPAKAPAAFFVDIQPDQLAAFESLAATTPGVERVQKSPMIRARITAIKGVPAEEVQVKSESRWAVRGDRGVTWSAGLPENSTLTAGTWWPPDYQGPPVISLTADVARGLGVGIGDRLTLSILGRSLDVSVASLREVQWETLSMNFTIVFPPGILEGAPQTWLATAHGDDSAAEALIRRTSGELPGVTAIKVREILSRVSLLIGGISWAVRAVAAVTLLSGLLVLAETLRASLRRRFYETVILKTVGATRADILGMLLAEHALVGLLAAACAAGLGTLAAWLAVTRLMEFVTWQFLPGPAFGTAGAGIALTVLLGLSGMRRVLGQKPGPVLRNE